LSSETANFCPQPRYWVSPLSIATNMGYRASSSSTAVKSVFPKWYEYALFIKQIHRFGSRVLPVKDVDPTLVVFNEQHLLW